MTGPKTVKCLDRKVGEQGTGLSKGTKQLVDYRQYSSRANHLRYDGIQDLHDIYLLLSHNRRNRRKCDGDHCCEESERNGQFYFSPHYLLEISCYRVSNST